MVQIGLCNVGILTNFLCGCMLFLAKQSPLVDGPE